MKALVSVFAMGIAIAFTGEALADISKATTEADCVRAGGAWNAKGNGCAENFRKARQGRGHPCRDLPRRPSRDGHAQIQLTGLEAASPGRSKFSYCSGAARAARLGHGWQQTTMSRRLLGGIGK